MRDQSVDLALVFAIDLVKQVKSQYRLADRYFIAIVEILAADPAAVKKGSVSRIEVGQNILR